MSDVNDLINALSQGDMVKANDTFSAIMSDKINSSLDDSRIQMAQDIMGVPEEVEEVEAEVEIDDEL
jgi:hypothetical protein